MDTQYGKVSRTNCEKLYFNEPVFDSESSLGNLITNLMNSACPGHDFVITTAVSFRQSWYSGIIDYSWVDRMFPTEFTIASFEITGKELIETLKIVQSAKKAFHPTYELKLKVSIDRNSTKKFISAILVNSSQIVPNKIYRGLTTSKLLRGSQYFGLVVGKVFPMRNRQYFESFKILIAEQLKKLKEIREGSLIDPLRPRLKVVKI